MSTEDLGSILVATKQPKIWTAAERRPAWPLILGVIAIGLGVLGVLGGLWGAIEPLWAGSTAGDVGPAERATFEVGQQWRAWTIPLSLVAGVIAAGLVLAGILLLTRRAQARRICLVWAAVKLALVIASTAVNYRIAREIVALTSEQSEHAPRVASVAGTQFAELSTMVSLGGGVLWGIALPLFLLIWFTRERICDEVAGWR
jgi:hypothetical protein